MSNHEKVYVVCENKCFEEGMTKQQIRETTVAASDGIKDQVTNNTYHIRWLTRAEYEALGGIYEPNTEYHVYDEDYSDDLSLLIGFVYSHEQQEPVNFIVPTPNHVKLVNTTLTGTTKQFIRKYYSSISCNEVGGFNTTVNFNHETGEISLRVSRHEELIPLDIVFIVTITDEFGNEAKVHFNGSTGE